MKPCKRELHIKWNMVQLVINVCQSERVDSGSSHLAFLGCRCNKDITTYLGATTRLSPSSHCPGHPCKGPTYESPSAGHSGWVGHKAL